MKGKSIVIEPTGAVYTAEWDRTPTLDELQGFVEGDIEMVPYFDHVEWDGQNRGCVAFCNETGKLDGKVVNDKATNLWLQSNKHAGGDILVGNVIILYGDPAFLRSL